MRSGDSLMGRRAAVIIKNVGVNACADPLLQATTQGLIGGVVLVAGDDPEAKGSQTAQDSRYYGELAELPVIEPDASMLLCRCRGSTGSFGTVLPRSNAPPYSCRAGRRSRGNPVPRKDGKGRLCRPGMDHERAGDCCRGTLPYHVRVVFRLAPEPMERRARRSRPVPREDPDRDREPRAGTGSGDPGDTGMREDRLSAITAGSCPRYRRNAPSRWKSGDSPARSAETARSIR